MHPAGLVLCDRGKHPRSVYKDPRARGNREDRYSTVNVSSVQASLRASDGMASHRGCNNDAQQTEERRACESCLHGRQILALRGKQTKQANLAGTTATRLARSDGW